MVFWSRVHEDKEAEAATESFLWPKGTVEIAFHDTAAVWQFGFIPGCRGYTGLGTVAVESPYLYYVACSNHVTGLVAAWPYQNS